VTANFIDGNWPPPASGASLDKVEPATGLVVGQVPDSDERDVQQAVESSDTGKSLGWRAPSTSPARPPTSASSPLRSSTTTPPPTAPTPSR